MKQQKRISATIKKDWLNISFSSKKNNALADLKAFTVKDSRMNNGTINDTPINALILGKEVKPQQWNNNAFNKYGYVLIKNKEIHHTDILINENTIICKSRNINFTDITIKKEEVTQLFEVIERSF